MRIFSIFILFCLESCAAFSTSQLPLSQSLISSFPKILSNCFAIANNDISAILHEKNSDKQTHMGTFVDIIYEQSMQQQVDSIEYCKNQGAIKTTIFSNNELENKTTMRDICAIVRNILSNAQVIFIKSPISGIGVVFKYKNKNNSIFICALYGYNSKEQAELDIIEIKKWLDQFFIYRVSKKNAHVTNIPVFYGDKSILDVRNFEDFFVLLSEKLEKTITKTTKYKAMLQAPVTSNDIVAAELFKTSTFQKHSINNIKAIENIKKAKRYKVVLDSISYIIFARPFFGKSQKISE